MTNAANAGASATIDVVVPTFRRPEALRRCLVALGEQTRPPDRILVGVRVDDESAATVFEQARRNLPFLDVIIVDAPGVIAAMSACVAASTGDIIAFTDDDAAPRPDWIAKLLRHFDDARVGGVGGRDAIPGADKPRQLQVGTFSKMGRLIGNHHLGIGGARDVDVLKGVNMAFRAEALALPAAGILRGTGAQVDLELLLCAWSRAQGWSLRYDPNLVVDHFGEGRAASSDRTALNSAEVFDAAYNSIVASTILARQHLVRRAGYGLLVGSRQRPGLLRAAIAATRGERDVWTRLAPSIAGRIAGSAFVMLGRPRRVIVRPARELQMAPTSPRRLVLVAHDVDDSGGMEHAFAQLVRQLYHRFPIVVVSSTIGADLLPLVDWHQVRVLRHPFPVKFSMFFVRGAFALRAAREPGDVVQTLGAIVPNRTDVVSLHFCHAGFRTTTGAMTPAGAPFARRTNTRLARSLAIMAERWCYRPSRMQCFLAVSANVGEEASHHYPNIPVQVIPNGVDHKKFRPDPARRARIRAREHCDNELVCLFVGGDWDRKGLGIAIGAVAEARELGVEVVLWVVGRGDTERFRTRARKQGVASNVRFFGAKEDVADFYRGADVLLFPSSYEVFSLTMLEAAASGLPMILPAISGAAELVGDNQGGMVVDRSCEAFAAALQELSADATKRACMGVRARERAAEYTWERAAASSQALYERLLPQLASSSL